MSSNQEQLRNQAAYRHLRSSINQTYPAGRYVAIAGGQIVADAASFEELDTMLHRMGQHSTDVLVVQAGIDYPEAVVIFSHDVRS